MLGARKKRAEEIQKRFLESTEKSEKSSTLVSSERSVFQSPKQGAEFPNAQKMATPKLGRGFAEGEDVLFFDISPPAAKSNTSAQATKLAAIQKLQAKGQTLTKADPNSIKRKRSSSAEELVAQRVASHAPASTKSPDENEPAMKKHRDQLAYLESKEFQKILNAKSKHTGILKEVYSSVQYDVEISALFPQVAVFAGYCSLAYVLDNAPKISTRDKSVVFIYFYSTDSC
eukprot:XP_004920873.2 PREDICTED: protein MCM10 homolog [Xenopus tropicalis]